MIKVDIIYERPYESFEYSINQALISLQNRGYIIKDIKLENNMCLIIYKDK